MDLTQLANLGEFIGGIAVIATLAYLAVQIRQGQALARAESETKSADLWVMHCLQPALHPGLARIIEVGLADLAALDQEETRRLRWWMMHYFFLVEGMWRKHHQGLLSREAWEGFERTLAGMWHTQAFTEFWEGDPVTFSFSTGFRDYVLGLRSAAAEAPWRPPGSAMQ